VIKSGEHWGEDGLGDLGTKVPSGVQGQSPWWGFKGEAPKSQALFIKRVDNLAAIFAWKCLESRLKYGVKNKIKQ